MKKQLYICVIICCVLHIIISHSKACTVGHYTDGRTYDTYPKEYIEATGYTPIHITDIATFDLNQIDVLMINVASNDGPSQALLERQAFLEIWIRAGGKMILHDRSAGNYGATLLINSPFSILVRNTNTYVSLIPYGTGENELIQGKDDGSQDDITEETLQNSNGFVMASSLPSESIQYLISADNSSHVAAFMYPLGFGNIYYSGIPLDYYFKQSNNSQPGKNYRTIYTPNLLNMICGMTDQPKPEEMIGDSCDTAQSLTKLTNPYEATTTGYSPDFYQKCGNYAPDRIFYIDVPQGHQIEMQQVSNTYDSQHSMRYGGNCPGTYEIACVNDIDTRVESWLNLTGRTVRVYWINGAYYRNDHGDFVLRWELTKPDINAVWTGQNSSDWDDPENWDIGHVPNEVVGVYINSGALNYPVLNGKLAVNDDDDTIPYRCRELRISNGGQLHTYQKVYNYGVVQINGGNWFHRDNNDSSIILEYGSLLEINDGTLSCGDPSQHNQTDLIVKSSGSLIINGGSLEISDKLELSNGAYFTATAGHVSIGGYSGTLAAISNDAWFDVSRNASFYLDQATIEIKNSGNANYPGLRFHPEANITLNNGTYVFSNASSQIQTIYAELNGYPLPRVIVQLLDNTHDVIFSSAHNAIGQLTINRGTFRLNGSQVSLYGDSPAIVVGNESGILLVDSGTISFTQNQASLTAIQIQSGGRLEIQENGRLERQLSMTDNHDKVIHINSGGTFYLNGGTVVLDNQNPDYAWGMTIDSGGNFQMDSGTFFNDAQMHCYGSFKTKGGTFHLVSQTDESNALFRIYNDATILAQNTIFDTFSLSSGESGIQVYTSATIGETSGDDLFDFDSCTFQNWHPQGTALTVDTPESFTITTPTFNNSQGNNIVKTTGMITVTGSNTGTRGGEFYDAEPEGYTQNHVNWDNTVTLSGKSRTGLAVSPPDGQPLYYASNTQVEILGASQNGLSLFWLAEPSGTTIPEFGESSAAHITLIDDCQITWYSGIAGRWGGYQSSQWDDPANWSDHKIPTQTTPVTIVAGSTYYPVLHESLSINSNTGVHNCMSLSLSQNTTITTHATVYCNGSIELQQARWHHLGNTIDSFQIANGGKLLMDNASFTAGDPAQAPFAGLTINSSGILELISSTVKIYHGLHVEALGNIDLTNSQLFLGLSAQLTDCSFQLAEQTGFESDNSSLTFVGDGGINYPAILFHTNATLDLQNTDFIIRPDVSIDTLHANFGNNTIDDLTIQMADANQTFQLVSRSVKMNHLFLDNGVLDNNGQNIEITGDNTAMTIGSTNENNSATVKLESGKIHVTGAFSGICAMHILNNGKFLISNGVFERKRSLTDNYDRVIWVAPSGIFEQTGGTVTINNSNAYYQWETFIEGEFKLVNGLFQSDSRITCKGLMNLDGGRIEMASNSKAIDAAIHVHDNAIIHAQNTEFVSAGIRIYENASIGTSSGDDADDFDHCTFENWPDTALTVNNSESFTITTPSFNNNSGTNISKNTSGFINVSGENTGTRGGEQYDSDPEGNSQNAINWENTRALVAENATAYAVKPAANETVYYASGATVQANGEIMTGSVIHWIIQPQGATEPAEGEGKIASFTIDNNATIVWYSGIPGHWTGRTSSEWNNPENWSDHRVPDATIDVLIPGNLQQYPVLDTPLYINQNAGTIQCKSLSLAADAELTVHSYVRAYSSITINGHWLHETNENNAIELFQSSRLILNNGSLVFNRLENDTQTDIFLHSGGSIHIENSDMTTRGNVISQGSIFMNSASWTQLNNSDNAIDINSGTLEISDSTLSCGDTALHSQTDLRIGNGAVLTLNHSTIAIVDAFKIENGASVIANTGLVQVGTYAGTASESLDTRFDIHENASFTLNEATIEIKGSTDKASPGLYFHDQANVVINGGNIIFKNARQDNPYIYVIPNSHPLPLVTIELLDASNEVVFSQSSHTINRLDIKRGTVRLQDNNTIAFTGDSPAITVGDKSETDDAALIVENGTIQVNQDKTSLQALVVNSDGLVDIQSNGTLERQLSIDDALTNVIHIKTGGKFYLNGGSVTLNNHQAQDGWGMTIDSAGLFQMNSGVFNNDASLKCYGNIRFEGGTFNVASQVDEKTVSFEIRLGATIAARNTIFDRFSHVSGESGIHVYNHANIGDASGDDDLDFDGCTFQNWHPQGMALTVENSESFTMTHPTFENSDGTSITKTQGYIDVTGSAQGSRWGEAFDGEFEGSTVNKINWSDTIHLYGRESTGQALHPENNATCYYAANTLIDISGATFQGSSLLWEITPEGASIPESGESSPAQVTLIKNANITWYSGNSGQWTGAKSSQWTDKANWHDHKIPDITIDVIIPAECSHYPILSESLSINGPQGSNQCKSLIMEPGTTITTQNNVYCFNTIEMNGASWYHTANQMNAFQVGDQGRLLINNNSELLIGDSQQSPLAGITITDNGELISNNSSIQISHGLHLTPHAKAHLTNTPLSIGLGGGLTDKVFIIDENAQAQLDNAPIRIKACADLDTASIQFHTHAEITFLNAPIYFERSDAHDIMYVDFGGHTVNDIHIQMDRASQAVKLISNTVQIENLFIDKGVFDPNGNTVQIYGSGTAITIGNDSAEAEARFEMTAGDIQITGNAPRICAMHIYAGGTFSMSGGSFARSLTLNDSYDRVLWIESGSFEQSGGTVTINNHQDNKPWDVLINENGIFRMTGGVFENDAGIDCHGLMDLDGGHIKVSSSENESETSFNILANATIQARHTKFSRYSHSSAKPGINVKQYALVGTQTGDDDDDFDHCEFEDWHPSGHALTLSNGESFTINNPVFNNPDGINIYQDSNATIYVTGSSLGNRGGEQFDSDPEGSTINLIQWENTRTLMGNDQSARAQSPAMNQTYYYGAGTSVTATGELLTGTAIHWHIVPPEAAEPSGGDSESAKFTINENAKIVWYSGFPGKWIGDLSSEWTEPGNWSDYHVPDHTIDVTIGDNLPFYPVLNQPLYVNANNGIYQCRSLKLLPGASFTSTSRVIAYSAIELNDSTWSQETHDNNAIEINSKGKFTVIESVMSVGMPDTNPQTCVKINDGGMFQMETGHIAIADIFHVAGNGHLQLSGGQLTVGAESNQLSKISPAQTPAMNRFLVDGDASLTVTGGKIDIQVPCCGQAGALLIDPSANINCPGGVFMFHSLGSGNLQVLAGFGGHDLYQVRIDLAETDHQFMLSGPAPRFSQLFIHKGEFDLSSHTLSFTGAGPSIIIGDQSGVDDARLLLKDGAQIHVNQDNAYVKALLIQSDGQFLMSGGQFFRDVFVEDDFDAVIHVAEGGFYQQTGGEVVINNQSSDHYWGVRIDNNAHFHLHGGTFENDAKTWCFGNMQIIDATYLVASSENESQASFSIESSGNIQAQNAIFARIFTEQGLLIKSGAGIGESPEDDAFDFDQCQFNNWHAIGAALTVENSESFTMYQAVFDNTGGLNINKSSAGQIRVIGQSTGLRGGELHDGDIEGGMTNYIHWDNTCSLTGKSISGEAIQPGNLQTIYYAKNSNISATGKGYPISWEVSPSSSVSITGGESTPAEFVLYDDATIEWYSIKPGMWRGNISSDWHDPMNWDDNKVPTELSDATIPYTYTNAPIINDAAVCKHLTMKENAQLLLFAPLTIKGNLTMAENANLDNGNTILEIHGDWQNEGIFNPQTGTVVLGGYSNCQIIQYSEEPLPINRLIIEKQSASAVLSFGVVIIQEELILKSGVPHFTSPLKYGTNATLTYANLTHKTTGTELSSDPLPSVIQIDSQAGVTLSKDLIIENKLIINNGYLALGDYDLHIHETAILSGLFSKDALIVTNGTGAVTAEINQPKTLFFPVGSLSENADYAPFTLIFHDGIFNDGEVTIYTRHDKPDENTSISNYADQYWQVTSSGISNYSCTVLADLDDTDILGNKNGLYFGRWNGQNWYLLNPAQNQSPVFVGIVNDLGLFTGGEHDIFASRILLAGHLNHFCGVKAGGISDEKTYAISGQNLISDIVITPPDQFEISTQTETGFIAYPQSLHIPPTNAEVPETQLYVRFRPSGTQSVQDQILHHSENAKTEKITASGSGIFIRTITLSARTPAEDIQVQVILDPDTFEYDNVLDGGADIRFKKGSKNYPYWIQEWNSQGESIIWVRILDPDVTSFDMEYGKESMSPASNGEDTFALFDDFSGTQLDTEKWYTRQITTSISNGSLIIKSLNASGGMSSVKSFESSKTYAYAAVYQAALNTDNVFILFGFTPGTDPWVDRTGIYGYQTLNRYGKQNFATDTSHETNKAIALYDENLTHLFTIALNQGYGFDDNYIEYEDDPLPTAHAAISTYQLGGHATVDWMFVYKNATPQINTTLGAECNMPGGGIWLGNVSSDWSTPENWNTGGVPKNSDNVLINPGCPNMPRLTATANCKDIEIKRNASLNLGNYQLNIYGKYKKNGTLIPQNGAICFRGNTDVEASGLGPETRLVGNVDYTQRYDYYGNYYLGYKFKIFDDITVFSFRHYFGKNVTLWTDKGTMLATVTVNGSEGRWTEHTLPEPVTLTGNESYILAAYTGGEPYFLSDQIESNFPDGKIQESRRSTGNRFPNILSSVHWWMVDLVYKTGSGTGFADFNQLIIQKTGNHFVAFRNVHIDNRLTINSGQLIINNLLTYSADAALEYAIDNFTTGNEFPSVDGPNNLIINSSGTINLAFDRQINGRLTMLNGKLQLDKHNLSLGPEASVKVSGQDSFIVTNDTGKIRQYITGTRTCVFPLGYTQSTPLTMDLLSAQIEQSAFIDVSLHNQHITENAPMGALNSLAQYWQIEQSGITDMTCHLEAEYSDANIGNGNEKYFMGAYKQNDQWISLSRVDLQTNTFSGDATDLDIVSAFEYDLANHLPTSENKTVSIMENEYYPFTITDFAFFDQDPYDTFQAIRITQLPVKGQLTLQTDFVTNQQILDAAQVNHLIYKPGINDSGQNYASLAFQVQDSDLDFSENTYSITFHVIRINKAPDINQIGPIEVTISEDFSTDTWSPPYISANDPDGDTLEWQLVTPPEHGDASVSGIGARPEVFQYTPDVNFHGEDQLIIGVFDTAIEPLSDTIAIHVTVVSVNDAPEFTCEPAQVTLYEDFPGTFDIIVKPAPVPSNEASEKVNYYITPETNSKFHTTINETTGKLTLSAIENKSGHIDIEIVATDLQPQNAVVRKTLPITIIPVNDPPVFQVDQTEITASEDFTETYVINVIPESVPEDETSQSVNYYLSPSQIEFVQLVINPDTGQLTITSIPDANGMSKVEIWADDNQTENNLAHQSIWINVAPVNDPPSFHLSNTNVRLEQDFEETVTITPYPGKIPADEKTQNIVYRMSPSSVSFANININPSTGIITISSISNETGSASFEVTADDNQAQNNQVTATFDLHILEKMPPLSIQVTRDIVQLAEDFPDVEIVETILETNTLFPDRSATFSLTPTSIDFANIAIDSDTGTITITHKPNGNGTQEFTIHAVDQLDPELTATDSFTLNINPVNDPPIFELSDTVMQCQENQLQPIVIDIIPGQQPQDETAQSVIYSISPVNSSLLDIQLNKIQNTIQILPRHNQNGVATIAVIASENASEFATFTQQFSVTVLDVNSPPIFEISAESINIHEDFEILTLTVTPMEQPLDEQDQVVTYSIHPESLDFIAVSIDEQTGTLTFESMKDLSGQAVITLTAHEDGVDENPDHSQQVDINVYSVNDPPTFSVDRTVVSLAEDFSTTETVSVIADLQPVDEAEQVVTYRLSPKTVDFANISIDQNTGTISIQSINDLSGSAILTIIADDHSDLYNQASRNIELIVSKENDPPRFTLSQTAVTLHEDFSGTTTIEAIIQDPPVDEIDQPVSFNIFPTEVAFATISTISALDGVFQITSKANQHGYQRFKITADDLQKTNNTSFRYFDLTVTSVNDPPEFSLSETQVIIYEDCPTTTIIDISPMYLSADESGPVSYALTPKSAEFIDISVDSNAKKIYIDTIPNKTGDQTFTITADDHQSKNNTAKTTFRVFVEPVNDPPVFTLHPQSMTLMEDFSRPVTVNVFPGSIPDDEQDQTVIYDFQTQGNDLAKFSFDSLSGQLTMTSLPNANGSQCITIIADDQQSVSNTYAQTLILDITPVNDIPAFKLDANEIVLAEDFIGLTTLSWEMIGVPMDEVSQTLTFQLSPSNCDFVNISVDNEADRINLKSIANANGSQQFEIIADDGQEEHSQSSQFFHLIIQAVNDAPAFQLSANEVTVNEDFVGDRTIYVTPMEIPLDEIDDNIRYTLLPKETPIANVHINDISGEITFRSNQNEFGTQVFTVIANDYKATNQSYAQALTLTVLSVNDAPQFTLSRYSINVEEDFSEKQSILLIPGLSPSNESNQTTTYSLNPSTVDFAWIDIDHETGLIEIQSMNDGNGSQLIKVVADDGQAENNATEISISLTIEPVNDPPKFSLSQHTLTLSEDFPETQLITSKLDPVPLDEQNQIIQFSLSSETPDIVNISFNRDNGSMSISPIANANGTQVVTIISDDGQRYQAQDEDQLTIQVMAVNDPPSFTLSPSEISLPQNFTETQWVEVIPDIVPIDEQNQPVAYELYPQTGVVVNSEINPSTGRIGLNPIPNQSGTQVYTVTAYDGQAVASTSFTVTVRRVSAIFVNFITQDAREGYAPLDVSFVSQVQGNVNRYEWKFGDGAMSTNPNPTHEYTQPGYYSVRLTAFGADGSKTIEKTNYIWVKSRILQGTVMAKDTGKGLAGYIVEVFQDSRLLKSSVTDNQGKYILDKLPKAGNLIVSAWPPYGETQYFQQYYNQKENKSQADKLSTQDNNLTHIDFSLERAPNIGIQGCVYAESGNFDSGIFGIQVDIYSNDALFGVTALTDENGCYSITHLKQANDYLVSVWWESLVKDYYYAVPESDQVGAVHPLYSVSQWQKASLVTPSAPSIQKIDIILDETANMRGTIIGTVYNSDNSQLAGVWVTARSDKMNDQNSALSDANGRYTITELTPVSEPEKGYIVEIDTTNYPFQAFDGADLDGHFTRVVTGRKDIDFYLRMDRKISGRITTQCDIGLRARVVAIQNGQSHEVISDSTGHYVIDGLSPALDYILGVFPSDAPVAYYPDTNRIDEAHYLDLLHKNKIVDFDVLPPSKMEKIIEGLQVVAGVLDRKCYPFDMNLDGVIGLADVIFMIKWNAQGD